MTSKSYQYMNPLGEIKDISYNNVDTFTKNNTTRNAQLEDIEKKYESYNLQLGLWSFTASIFILILLVLLRNINN